MSFHRFLYLCGWTAVILLAIAGFAAFNTRSNGPSVSTVISESVWGGSAGAVSAQGWMALTGTKTKAPIVASTSPGGGTTKPRPVQPSLTEATTLDTGWLDSITLRNLVETQFATSDVNRAIRLAWCLSRFDVDLVNPSTGAVGLFQILPEDWGGAVTALGLAAEADPFDPLVSAQVASYITYHGNGWDYWNCSG
ncbi:MAG: hypothetical protein ACT4OP_00755 [Actinomycetota bacterium]